MTVTEAPRDVVDAPAGPAPSAPPTGLTAVVGSGDPRTIGRLFIGTSLLFLLMAGVLAILVGFERVDLSGFEVLDSDIVRQLFTLQSIAAVFLGVLPLLIGLATAVVPLQVGASTVAFPAPAPPPTGPSWPPAASSWRPTPSTAARSAATPRQCPCSWRPSSPCWWRSRSRPSRSSPLCSRCGRRA